jgi:hypothetical protein
MNADKAIRRSPMLGSVRLEISLFSDSFREGKNSGRLPMPQDDGSERGAVVHDV